MRILLLSVFVISIPCLAQTPVAGPVPAPLWPEGQVPLAQGTGELDRPMLTAYLPAKDKAVGTAVVVCPGGGYAHLAMDHEGKQIAQYLNGLGIAAFVLQYRLGPKYHHPAELMDAQRAIRTARAGVRRSQVR